MTKLTTEPPAVRRRLHSHLFVPFLLLPLLFLFSDDSLAALFLINRYIYDYPEAIRQLDTEKTNTTAQSRDAVHPCDRTHGRIFSVTHPLTFTLAGLSVYVYVPGSREKLFAPAVLRLSLLDSTGHRLASQVSASFADVIDREGSGAPTFEVFFPFSQSLTGEVPSSFVLECLTDDPDTYRISEAGSVTDGLTAYFNSTTQTSYPYYLAERKVLFTTFSPHLSPHFPPLTPVPTPSPTPSLSPTPTPSPPPAGGPPPFHPVILIHGLGGSPGAFDGTEDENRNYVKLLTSLGYPADYLALYSYGYKEDGRGGRYYNYQGDIKEIALGMEATVNTLSQRYLADGGDGKVDIIAHSLGNLVTRQYLLTHPESHKIRRYIAVGAPFKGAWPMGVDKGVRSIPLVGNIVEEAVAETVLKIHNRNNPNPLSRNSVASIQATPGSDFLDGPDGINKTKISNLELYTVYGDVNATLRQTVFGATFESKIDIGDGLILSESATYHDWVDFPIRSFAYNDGMIMDLKFDTGKQTLAAEILVPNLNSLRTLHTDLLIRKDSQSAILCLISVENTSQCE